MFLQDVAEPGPELAVAVLQEDGGRLEALLACLLHKDERRVALAPLGTRRAVDFAVSDCATGGLLFTEGTSRALLKGDP